MTTFQLPLFPLQAVLFPGGVLPLRIFEVRYLDLINRCEKEGAPFGVICLSRGSEVQRAPAAGEAENAVEPETFHTVGTMAQISVVERPQAGLILIRCRGGRRFRLLNSTQMKHGLWTGEAEYLEDDPIVEAPEDLSHVREALRRLLEHMQAQAKPKDELPIQPPYEWNSCGWIANRWCDILPVSPQLKQQFLAVDNPLVRLELVADLLAHLQISAGPAVGGGSASA